MELKTEGLPSPEEFMKVINLARWHAQKRGVPYIAEFSCGPVGGDPKWWMSSEQWYIHNPDNIGIHVHRVPDYGTVTPVQWDGEKFVPLEFSQSNPRFRVGDLVRIVRKVDREDRPSWEEPMDACIGSEGTIRSRWTTRIGWDVLIPGRPVWGFAPESLELVRRPGDDAIETKPEIITSNTKQAQAQHEVALSQALVRTRRGELERPLEIVALRRDVRAIICGSKDG